MALTSAGGKMHLRNASKNFKSKYIGLELHHTLSHKHTHKIHTKQLI